VQEETWDVAIIGAGAAGLAAASALAAQRHSVLLLEARERIGGRIWTRHEPQLPAPVELGAEFIHGQVPETLRLLREANKAALDSSGSRWSWSQGRLRQRAGDLFAQIQRGLAAYATSAQPDMAFAAFLAEREKYGLSEDACRLARASVEGFDAADPARISARSVAREWGSGGMLDAPQFRPEGGYDSILEGISASLDRAHVRLQLQSPVSHVTWRAGAVRIAAELFGQPFQVHARRLIVTLPVGVLLACPGTAGAVSFEPALDGKHAALRGLASGSVLKVALRFRSAFWEEVEHGRYRDAAFFHAPDLTFPTFWTCRPVRAPLLNAWLGGPRAGHLAEQGAARIIREALASVAALFSVSPESLEPESAYFHDWGSDPFARGAYSYITVDGQKGRESLAGAVSDTLFFAGEATDSEEGGTVTGALRSGARAAREVHESLDGSN